MSQHGQGALAPRAIREMCDAGFVTGAESTNIRQASLDLSISEEVYQVDGIFQPRRGESVRDVLELVGTRAHNLEQPLERNTMYIARLNETLALPSSVYGFANPKSTTGRLDIHARLIADGVPRYDSVTPAGYTGELWASIVPKTFPIKMRPGQSVNQIRFFTADTRFDELELEIAMKQDGLIWNIGQDQPLAYGDLVNRDGDGAALLTLDGTRALIGFRGIPGDEPVDLDGVDQHDPALFFEPVYKHEDDYIRLSQNEFYILSTREAVKVPPHLACEMAPMDERSGDFRSHYAGFIDPGWGYGTDGDAHGRPLTLEVRPFENIIARDHQPIAKIRFERLTTPAEEAYDAMDSNYTIQTGPKLAKQFRNPEL